MSYFAPPKSGLFEDSARDFGGAKYDFGKTHSLSLNSSRPHEPAGDRQLELPDPPFFTNTAMFTGLIEAVGRVVGIASQPPGKRFTIESRKIKEGIEIGDSISINGCCLTVVQIVGGGHQYDFEAGEETLSRTNLGELRIRSRVNLERALASGDRIGGHYVTGHIDDLGTLIERKDDPPWSHFRFRMPKRLASQVAAKGSIAIDGISLTVVDADRDTFSVALIPHTLEETTLGIRKVGDRVNLETDVLAKYVERSLAYRRD